MAFGEFDTSVKKLSILPVHLPREIALLRLPHRCEKSVKIRGLHLNDSNGVTAKGESASFL